LNYLGHAYFSFNHPEILVGNLISDFVKGKKKFDYPEGIQLGIMFHRELDEFSDNHEATQRAKGIFRPYYRLYAAAFIDVTYDYFIANDPGLFNEASLLDFTQETYQQLEIKQEWFPEKFARMFPYMKAQNWLFNYRHIWGIERSYAGLVRRASYITESETASRLFENNLPMLQECYDHFAKDVKEFAKSRFDILTNQG
jgi:acyl carrier protein phosphodiesterase